ncbi:MAG: HTH-type transcriptional regulator BetI [Planctomycetes bacterium]|nr:HTH-type transcriptional regulator BetI [Planctomycetota bacterium]
MSAPARHEQLLDAAERVFASRGPDAASLRGLAEAAGVSTALVCRHFADKADLYDAVLARRVLRERDASRAIVRAVAAEPLRTALADVAERTLARAADDPAALRLALHAALLGHPLAGKLRRARSAALAAALSQTLRTGSTAADAATARFAATAFVGLVEWLALSHALFPDPPLGRPGRRALAEELADLFASGLLLRADA